MDLKINVGRLQELKTQTHWKQFWNVKPITFNTLKERTDLDLQNN